MKTITTLPTDVRMMLPALRGVPGTLRVDREARIIRGVAMIQRGPLNDGDMRPWFIDDKSLSQVMELFRSQQNGLKARWTHPNMSNDGLGKYLGRWRKPRLSANGEMVLADLYLSSVAFRGKDSRGQYVLDLADEDPEAFGVSLAPRMLDEKAMEEEEIDGKQPMRFLSLIAGDVVDEPAATRGGFFGGQLSIATAPQHATQIFDQLFADASADVIRERSSSFVETYLSTRFGSQLPTPEPPMATTTTPAPETPPADVVTAKQFGDLSTKVDSLATSIQTLVEAQKSAPTPPANGGQLGVADQIAAAQLAEKKRFLDILDLANTAGIKDANKHAREWVDKGLSIDQAKAAITDLNIAQNKLTPDSGQPNPETDSALRREYRANLAAFQKQGVSEDDYVEIQKSLAETGGV